MSIFDGSSPRGIDGGDETMQTMGRSYGGVGTMQRLAGNTQGQHVPVNL